MYGKPEGWSICSGIQGILQGKDSNVYKQWFHWEIQQNKQKAKEGLQGLCLTFLNSCGSVTQYLWRTLNGLHGLSGQEGLSTWTHYPSKDVKPKLSWVIETVSMSAVNSSGNSRGLEHITEQIFRIWDAAQSENVEFQKWDTIAPLKDSAVWLKGPDSWDTQLIKMK